MCFAFADLLHNSQKVDGGEEIPPREFSDGLGWLLGCWIAQLVNGWDGSFSCMLAFLESQGRELVFDFGDRKRKFTAHLDRWRRCFIFALFFGFKFNWCVFAVSITESEEAMSEWSV